MFILFLLIHSFESETFLIDQDKMVAMLYSRGVTECVLDASQSENWKLGAALARQSGREEAECVRHLFQRLSILLVKGNAALFLNRQPHHPEPEIDGVE